MPVAHRVPANWIKVNSTKAMHRYHPPEVLEALDALTLAKEELSIACGRAWDAFLAEFASHYVAFRAAVQALAALDCLHSLAIVSRNQVNCFVAILQHVACVLLWNCVSQESVHRHLQDVIVRCTHMLNYSCF